jgi:hypothetical protein
MSILADWEFYLRLSAESSLESVARPLLAYYIHFDSMYHNPDGIIKEFAYLESKHSSGHLRIEIDYPTWYLRFIRMAIRQGDRRAALQYLKDAYSKLGPKSLTLGVGRWARNKPSQWKPVPDAYSGEVSEWIRRYRIDAVGDAKYPVS